VVSQVPRTRRLAGALAAFGVAAAACGPGPWVYDKAGVTYAEWRRDDAECRQHSGRPSAPNAIDRDSYDRCMRERGYAVPLR
jgi:hypothetical protein